MKDYKKNLYRKFKTRIIKALNGDDFYGYFMKIVNSGKRFYQQKSEVIVREVDKTWVEAIFDCIPNIDAIVRHPRRFMKREELIVPIDLSKATGSDSVKHLSSHSHFIDRIEGDGSVVPKQILNINNEDSYELYENRFIFTLINEIELFVSKRYDAIFDIGNESHSTLKLKSMFGDKTADEDIAYDLTLRVHQGKDYYGKNEELVEALQKLEFIRKIIGSYKNSELYQALIGTHPVKSPIQRTNLIIKEPNYRKCYELWNFLERYKEVGFTVNTQTRDVEFDEQYVDELNSIILFNYLSLKNKLDEEQNKKIDPESYRRKRVIKPKFVTNIIEDYIADYDINEKELSRIISDAIKKAYKQKAQSFEEKVLIALTEAINDGIKRQQVEKGERRIAEALQAFFYGEAIKKEELEKERIIENALKEALYGSA